MNERIKLMFWKVVIVFHLTAMVLYTARLMEILPPNAIGNSIRRAITLYSKLTMGPYRFAFFAPSIPGWYTVKIYGKGRDGKEYEYNLPQPNREIQIRYNRMLRNIREEKLREPMFRSIASYIKTKHTQIDSVNLIVFHTDTPTMEDFRKGKAKTTELVYNLTY